MPKTKPMSQPLRSNEEIQDDIRRRSDDRRSDQQTKIAEKFKGQRPYTDDEMNQAGCCAPISDHEKCLRLEAVLAATQQDLQVSHQVSSQRVEQIADLRVANDMLVNGERERYHQLREACRIACEKNSMNLSIGLNRCDPIAVIAELGERLTEVCKSENEKPSSPLPWQDGDLLVSNGEGWKVRYIGPGKYLYRPGRRRRHWIRWRTRRDFRHLLHRGL